MVKESPKYEDEPRFTILTGSKLEASTLYKSPYYEPSFQFPYNPDPLVSGNNYRIYDEMLSDDQVKAVLNLKKNFVINTGWHIKCEDDEIKDFITETLNNINKDSPLESTFEDILLDILSSYEYGFSLTEPIFDLNQDNLYIYKSFKTRPPHTFRFEIDDKGNVIDVIQSTVSGEKYLDPDLFLHHVYQQQFGNPYGKSDLNAAHNAWKAKKFIDRFLAVHLERFASPTIVGKYENGMDADQIARFLTMLETIQNNTAIVIPKDTTIDFIQSSKDSSDAYIKALDYYNLRIARAILVPDLMGLSGGQTSGGAYSLGKKQFEAFMGTIEKDTISLSKKLTNKIVQPLVKINFGEQYDAQFQFIDYKDDDVIKLATLWSDTVKSKVFDPSDEEINHFRSLVGFPEGEVNRIPQQQDQPQPGLPGMPGNNMPSQLPEDKKIPPTAKQNKIGDPVEYVPAYSEKVKRFRDKSVYENKVNFTQIEDMLNTSEEKISKKLLSAGKDIYNDYISQIRDKGLLSKFRPEKINELQPKFLKPMNILFKNHFQDIFQESYDMARKEILPNGTTKFDTALLGNEFMDVLNAESFKVTGDYETEITKKAKNILMDGIKNGISESELIKLLRDELSNVSERWMDTLLRTKTNEIFNLARRSYWENDDIAKQIVEAYQFSAILDDRTSAVCESLDGNIYQIDSDIQRVTPPLHFNCRSLLIPITKFEDYQSEKIPSIQKIQDLGGNLKKFKEDGK